jgi:hypothetical protein
VGEGQRIHVTVGDGLRAGPRCRVHDDGCFEMRCTVCRVGELRGELAEHEVLAPTLDEAEGRHVPERRRTAVAEQDFPAVRQAEQRRQPGTNRADQ